MIPEKCKKFTSLMDYLEDSLGLEHCKIDESCKNCMNLNLCSEIIKNLKVKEESSKKLRKINEELEDGKIVSVERAREMFSISY
jgi:positive regulator of sigma E activity